MSFINWISQTRALVLITLLATKIAQAGCKPGIVCVLLILISLLQCPRQHRYCNTHTPQSERLITTSVTVTILQSALRSFPEFHGIKAEVVTKLNVLHVAFEKCEPSWLKIKNYASIIMIRNLNIK